MHLNSLMTEFPALRGSDREASGCNCAVEHAVEAPSPSEGFESCSESPVADTLTMQRTSLDSTQKWPPLLVSTAGQCLGARGVIRRSALVAVSAHQGFMVSGWCNSICKNIATEGL